MSRRYEFVFFVLEDKYQSEKVKFYLVKFFLSAKRQSLKNLVLTLFFSRGKKLAFVFMTGVVSKNAVKEQ